MQKNVLWQSFPEYRLYLCHCLLFFCVSFGICTASESAGIAVLYAVFVGFFIYRELTLKDIWNALKKTLISSSSIMLIIGFTTIFTWVLTMQKVPQLVAQFFIGLNMPAWGIALMFDVMILMIWYIYRCESGNPSSDSHYASCYGKLLVSHHFNLVPCS